ncbi:hypothetical protein L3V80_08365 [Thiotrichales bacterium 19S9-11]|nr:hypothetical protein [Thiotrichales bacterium 19S9-11]
MGGKSKTVEHTDNRGYTNTEAKIASEGYTSYERRFPVGELTEAVVDPRRILVYKNEDSEEQPYILAVSGWKLTFRDCLASAEYYASGLSLDEYQQRNINQTKKNIAGTLKDPSIFSKTIQGDAFGVSFEKNREILANQGVTREEAVDLKVEPGDIILIGETEKPDLTYKDKGGYSYHAEYVYAVEYNEDKKINRIFTLYQLATDQDVDFSNLDLVQPKYGVYKGLKGFLNYWGDEEKGSFLPEQEARGLILKPKQYAPEIKMASELAINDSLKETAKKEATPIAPPRRSTRGQQQVKEEPLGFVQQEIQRINGIEKAKFQNKKEDRLPIIEEQPKTKDKKKKTVRFSDDVAVKYVARYIRDMEEAEQAKNKVSISSLSLASSEDRPLRRSSRLNPSQIVSSAHEPQELEKEKSLPSKKAKNKVSISSLSLASSEDRPLRRSSRLNPSLADEPQELKKEKSLSSKEDRNKVSIPIRRSSRLNPSLAVSSAQKNTRVLLNQKTPLEHPSKFKKEEPSLEADNFSLDDSKKEIPSLSKAPNTKKAKGKKTNSIKGLNLMTINKSQETKLEEPCKPALQYDLREGHKYKHYYGPVR